MTAENKRTLGVLSVGIGSVATTLYAGVEAARLGTHFSIGSITQVNSFPEEKKSSKSLSDQIGMMPLTSICFGGFDILENNAFEAAEKADVLSQEDLKAVEPFLHTIPAFPGIYRERYLPGIKPVFVQPGSLGDQVSAVRESIRSFIQTHACDSAILVLCHSTEAYLPQESAAATITEFENAIENEDSLLSPSQLYTYAALKEGVSVINATPNPVLSVPALLKLAESSQLCLAGSDLKSGQTYLKSVLANAIRERMLGVRGWFSTNILGNRDGEVLNNPENFRAKEHTKKSVLDSVFTPDEFPNHYDNLEHQVHIHYYPPKGDNKEAWDSIQLFGWMGYDMELKINYQCKDSILAAPMILDLVLLLEFARRSGEFGVLEWLSSFFKFPCTTTGVRLENSHMEQLQLLHKKIATWQSAGVE